ncbi:MAG TPA: hypothetical protein PKN87_02290 [Syntrophomonadaceae bacterium]|nr:hypothetical protein [Syntrophomonadaceae bacterium]
MQRRIFIIFLAAALLVITAYKQNWYPFGFNEPESAPRSALVVNEQMQQAFDAGQGVWLVFSSAT